MYIFHVYIYYYTLMSAHSLTPSQPGEEEEEEDEEDHPRTSLWMSDKLKEMIRITNNDKQTSLHLAAVNGYDK